MIIGWRGKGILGLIPLLGVPILSVFVGIVLMDRQRKIAKLLPFFNDQVAGFTALGLVVLGCFCGSLICFALGRRWNREGGKHDVYFIPIEYFGLAAIIGSGSFMLLIAGLIVVGQVIKFLKH
jgi:hypothetical protein